MSGSQPPSPALRAIIHCDMDAFYASVEQLDAPELRHRPVIVGGDVHRGVVSACSYEARHYGVHSAQPMALAVRRCPGAVLRPVRMDRYREVSRAVFAVFGRFTDRIEPLSIDEAFLDVTGCDRLFGPATAIAARIRSAIREELGLVVSAGVARNKFLAKLASQRAKPDGLLDLIHIEPERFLEPLPVTALWGVGEQTEARLKTLGITTVGALRALALADLERLFGRLGGVLHELARGRDERPVVTTAGVKSVSHEETFAEDLHGREPVIRELRDLAERVAGRVRAKGLRGRRVTLKVRFADFSTVTRSRTLERGIDNGQAIQRTVLDLLDRTDGARKPVRLLGVGISDWAGDPQGDLFMDEGTEKRRALDRAMDQVHRRFGRDRLQPADLASESRTEEGGDGGE